VLDRPKSGRWRRYRARQKDGLACTQVQYDAAVVELLTATGWLDERDVGDRGAVGVAIARMLAASAKAAK
jgi:hypothetical protein